MCWVAFHDLSSHVLGARWKSGEEDMFLLEYVNSKFLASGLTDLGYRFYPTISNTLIFSPFNLWRTSSQILKSRYLIDSNPLKTVLVAWSLYSYPTLTQPPSISTPTWPHMDNLVRPGVILSNTNFPRFLDISNWTTALKTVFPKYLFLWSQKYLFLNYYDYWNLLSDKALR